MLVVGSQQLVEGRRARSRRPMVKCEGDECNLKAQHFVLYSNIKQALKSNFDIKARHIYPLMNSVELLKRRYDGSDASLNNSSRLVRDLLVHKDLEKAVNIFQSDAGRSLIDLYRTPVNGNEQNLACNKLRIEDIERAAKQLESNADLAAVFTNIHRNFVQKSASKCAKKACLSMDTSMSRIDYMLMRERTRSHWRSHARHFGPRFSAQQQDQQSNIPFDEHEFGAQEQKLCQFFKRTNESSCEISAPELAQIQFTGPKKQNPSAFVDSQTRAGGEAKSELERETAATQQAVQLLVNECRPMRSLLDYNLMALKWYNKRGLTDINRLDAHSCPRLNYWLQIDRICTELDSLANRETLTY